MVAVRAGLERGTLEAINPDLDVISIGPDPEDVHVPDEVLYLESTTKCLGACLRTSWPG